MLRHYDWQYIKRSQCFLESKALEVLLKEFAAEPSSHTRENGIFTTIITRPRGLRNYSWARATSSVHVNM
jgi:hypothetical protein